MVADFPYDEAKFTELVLYVADRLKDDPTGGAVKLNKALFFAEFAHVRATGRPITGAEYQKLPHGPAPRFLLPVRDQLIRDGRAQLVRESYLGYEQKRLTALRPPNLSLFTREELETVDQVLHELRGLSGTETSDISHEQMGWQMVEERETIPFAAAYLRPPVITDAIRRRAAKLAEQ